MGQVGLLQHPSGGCGVGTCDCRVDRVGRVQTVPIFRVLQCDDEACIPLRWSWYLEPPRARRSWLRGACDRQGSGSRWPSPPFVGKLRLRECLYQSASPLCIGAVWRCTVRMVGQSSGSALLCPIRRVLVLEGSSPRQTLSGMGLAEAKLFRAC